MTENPSQQRQQQRRLSYVERKQLRSTSTSTTPSTASTPIQKKNTTLQQEPKKQQRSLHMRKDSTGSIGRAFYSSNQGKEQTLTVPRRTRVPKKKNDEQDALEAQQQPSYNNDWMIHSLEQQEEPETDSNHQFGVIEPVEMSTIDGLSAHDYHVTLKRQSELEIAAFSAMALSETAALYSENTATAASTRPPRHTVTTWALPQTATSVDSDSSSSSNSDPDDWWDFFAYWLNPNDYLLHGAVAGSDGKLYFPAQRSWSLTAAIRNGLYNPLEPEFTSLQQFSWAVIMGLVMGVYVSVWKTLIEGGVTFMWKTLPAELMRLGVFTDLQGAFPLYHYMWMCPAVWGSILSYSVVVVPFKIPDQNEWITGIHSKGILDHRGFGALFVLSTLAMMSGLSLGPELPLVLTAGMVGSWFALVCKQSMLQARVLNLTAASAAVGGFFGFPMAGAMFVLEIPHRMGLQYFEALSPATIASIVAVLTNRLIINNDVTGYYSYPFLSASLPSEIFTSAIVYGLYGAALGYVYGKGCLLFKSYVHDLFQVPHHRSGHDASTMESKDLTKEGEETPLLVSSSSRRKKKKKKRREPRPEPPTRKERIFGLGCIFIQQEKKRAALAGFVAGALVGVIGMFLPHTMFWGEAQLQNLIDKGRTPLPIFTTGNEPTADLTALGYCMMDPKDNVGFGIGCSLLITFAKIVVIGLSLGTGIIGGHFWGPLFCGCSAAHLFTDVFHWISENYGVGGSLCAYPCVAILCTMGSAHVVTYRAHMAIMLILTLTISTFNPQNETGDGVGVVGVSGDYSAVFPLLVISVFVALMVSRSFVFYDAQRSRGDILAIPEVLCQPGMEGRPAVIEYMDGHDDDVDDDDDDDDEFAADLDSSAKVWISHGDASSNHVAATTPDYEYNTMDDRSVENVITQFEIECEFEKRNATLYHESDEPAPTDFHHATSPSIESLSPGRLDELLKEPLDKESASPKKGHRRFHTAPGVRREAAVPSFPMSPKRPGNRERADSGNRGKYMLRINSYGEIHDHQPSLLDQARERSASSATDSLHRRVASTDAALELRQRHRRLPSLPGRPRKNSTDGNGSVNRRHNRTNSIESIDSASSSGMMMMENTSIPGATLSLDDIEDSFQHVVVGARQPPDFQESMWTENSTM